MRLPEEANRQPGDPAPRKEEAAADETRLLNAAETAGGALPPPAVPVPETELHPETGSESLLRRIVTGNALVSVLSVLMALVVGGLLIALTDEEVADAAGYFFNRPRRHAGRGLVRGVGGVHCPLPGLDLFNFEADTFSRMIYPLTQTLTVATPLICAGLGVALAFRAGLLNVSRGPDPHWRHPGSLGWLQLAPARWPAPAGRHSCRCCRRCALGRHCRPAEGTDRCT